MTMILRRRRWLAETLLDEFVELEPSWIEIGMTALLSAPTMGGEC